MRFKSLLINNRSESMMIFLVALLALVFSFFTKNTLCLYASNQIPFDFCKTWTIGVSTGSGVSLDYDPVRIPVNARDLISSGVILPYQAWDSVLTSSSLQRRSFMAQDLDSTSAGWWMIVPTQLANTSANYKFFFSNSFTQRDNGMGFFENDYATIPSDSDFDITDNLELWVDVDVMNTSRDADDLFRYESLIDRHDTETNTGYGLFFQHDGSDLNIIGKINDKSVSGSWNTVDTGTSTKISLQFVNPNLNLYVNGIQLATTNTGLSAITNTSTNITVGEYLDKAVIRNFGINKNIITTNNIVARYNFDPSDIVENPSVAPNYTGTFEDNGSNNHDGTYNFNRSQTNLTLTIGNLVDVGADDLINIPDTVENIINQPFVDITSKTAENNFIPFYSFGETVADGIGLPRQMFWVSAFLITGLLLSIGVIMGTGSTPLAMVTMGMVLSFGTISGLYAQWFVVLFCAIMVLLWTSIKFMEETA